MIADINNNYYVLFESAKQQMTFMGYLLTTVWIINICNWLLRSPLNILGIYPRSLWGLIGIFVSPILHANFNHLFFNTIPFFVLGMFLLALGKNFFIGVSVILIIVQGILVWSFGRKAIHIGASGIISGYFGFLLGMAYLYTTAISLVLAFIAVYYFGSIMLGIFPTSEKVSWESHLAGMLSGIGLIYCFWNFPQYEILMLQAF